MPVNLNTKEKQQREVVAQARIRAGFQLSAFRRFFAEFNRISKEAADAIIMGAGMDAVGVAMKGEEARMIALLSTTYRQVFPVFGTRTVTAIAPEYAKTTAFSSNFETATRRYIQDYSPLKAVQINDTTRKNLNKVLVQSFDEGLGTQATALKIVEETGNISRVRATRIARTEVHAASNAANMSSVEGLNIPLKKVWLAAFGPRTRETHIVANRQVQDKDGFFEVGGSLLRYPGDPLGPADEVINCRCVQGWQTEQ